MANDAHLIDYHCHADLYPDCKAIFRECIERKIYLLAVTTTPKAWPRNNELTKEAPWTRAALGLHPQVAAERSDELKLFERYLSETPFVGEVGLDASPRFYASFETQLRVFERIVSLCVSAGHKVLSVHSVRTTAKVLQLLGEHVSTNRMAVVLHWFNGSKSEAKRAIALGCYFSVNHQMLCSPRGRAIVADLPVNRILTETDGPFGEIDKRPTRPSDVENTLRRLADLRRVTFQDLRAAVAANARALDEYAGVSYLGNERFD